MTYNMWVIIWCKNGEETLVRLVVNVFREEDDAWHVGWKLLRYECHTSFSLIDNNNRKKKSQEEVLVNFQIDVLVNGSGSV